LWKDVSAECVHKRVSVQFADLGIRSLADASMQLFPNGLRTYGLRKLCTWYAAYSTLRKSALIKCADIFVDNVHIELSLWDTAGQEEFDRLRSLSYDDTHAIMLCFSVDSKDSLENVESKWVGEIAENCQGVKLVLVALKCDLREQSADEEAEADGQHREKEMINYNQGLEVARRINALRYLECSAMRNRGVNEAFTEAARVALSVKPNGGKEDSKCSVM
jgi:Rho family protein